MERFLLLVQPCRDKPRVVVPKQASPQVFIKFFLFIGRYLCSFIIKGIPKILGDRFFPIVLDGCKGSCYFPLPHRAGEWPPQYFWPFRRASDNICRPVSRLRVQGPIMVGFAIRRLRHCPLYGHRLVPDPYRATKDRYRGERFYRKGLRWGRQLFSFQGGG